MDFIHFLREANGDRILAKKNWIKARFPGFKNRFIRQRYLHLEDQNLEDIQLSDFQPTEENIEWQAPELAETDLFSGETVPLLTESGTAVVTGVGAAGTGGVSTGTAVGGLAGAAGIIGGGGALFHYLKNNPEEDEDIDFDDPRDKKPKEHKKPVLSVDSEHNYLGPGNSVNTGDDPLPISDADRIAYNHDLNYLKAQTDQDIKDADSAAISEFVEKAKGGDWRSAVGAIGLQGKQSIESVIGRQYPPLPKGKIIWVNIL